MRSVLLRPLALLALIVRLTAADPAPVRLTLNENPFGPSGLVEPALRAELTGLHRYTDEQATALVAALAAKEGVAPEQIVLGELLEPLPASAAWSWPCRSTRASKTICRRSPPA